ncbi:ribonuclease HII [Shouchella hunanensis]|uniref:Ribonuclease HII n=1 Tax=Shouchella hunanensis TaxID=766894 RepID=A0ABY7W5T5_9BACI|nr:ribonuclease HII [Shouchella hunanensis]WDF03789.1 ribonuclease HII [Shouchella hunanensis]GAF23340.1 ribonuclease HII [Bacillus sp. JCM 19047]
MISITTIKSQLANNELTTEQVNGLREDHRKGVQALLKRYDAAQMRMASIEQMHQEMSIYELELRQQGYQAICGVDEVGRGPLAGPVTAAAVILPTDFKLLGLTDSKKLSKENREQYAAYIKEHAVDYQIVSMSAKEIDETNILIATKRAMVQAIQQLRVGADYLLLDAIELPIDTSQRSLIKGDSKSISIAAGSVLAKVWRDDYMEQLAHVYPEYGFEQHAGYGTKQHLDALEMYGMTREHRRTFRPVLERGKSRIHPKDQ